MPEIQLGDRVKDPITSYEGIAIAITTWLHGCVRIAVQAEALHEGKPIDDRYFDAPQLVIVERGVHAPKVLTETTAPAPAPQHAPGGPARESSGFRR